MDLVTFHRFPDLPAELRAMIFELCIPSRIIQPLYCSEYVDPNNPQNTTRYLPIVQRVRNELPQIVLVCKEAYAVILRGRAVYNIPMTPMSVPTYYGPRPQHPYTLLPVLLNPKVDIIWLGGHYKLNRCLRQHQRIGEIENGPFSLIAHPESTFAIDWSCLRPHWMSNGWRDDRRAIRNKEYLQEVFHSFIVPRSRCMVVLTDEYLTDEFQISHLYPEPSYDYKDRFPALIDFQNEVLVQRFLNMPDFWGWGLGHGYGIRLPTSNNDQTSTEENSFARRKEKALARCLQYIQDKWLEMNGCFDQEEDAKSLVPFEMIEDERGAEEEYGRRRPNAGIRIWDHEHPLVKELLAKLPTFSFGFSVALTWAGAHPWPQIVRDNKRELGNRS